MSLLKDVLCNFLGALIVAAVVAGLVWSISLLQACSEAKHERSKSSYIEL